MEASRSSEVRSTPRSVKMIRYYASTAPPLANPAKFVPCRSLQAFPADAVDSNRGPHHDVIALEPFQSFLFGDEALGSAGFTIYSATGCSLSAPLPRPAGV